MSSGAFNPDATQCHIQSSAIDVTQMRRDLPALPSCGGYVAFEGVVRNTNHGKKVLRLEYVAYEPLASKEMQRIAAQAQEKFGIAFLRCIHRQGVLEIGDTAVLIQTLSRHRREAFDACRFMIDQLKARVPIWKKEYYDDGSHGWTQCHEAGHGH